MNREQLKELLPIIQAAVEGKTIEFRDSVYKHWQELTNPAFNLDVYNYRIKPEPKYRSFNDTEECWQEMLKHQPFGWIKDKQDGTYVLITSVDDEEDSGGMSINGNMGWNFGGLMDNYTFADGTPFGIKEE